MYAHLTAPTLPFLWEWGRVIKYWGIGQNKKPRGETPRSKKH